MPNRSAPPAASVPYPLPVDPEEEALAQLCELVAKAGPLDVTDTDEYIEGSDEEFFAHYANSSEAVNKFRRFGIVPSKLIARRSSIVWESDFQ